jgi:integrase
MPICLATFLKASVRNGLGKIHRDMQLEPGKGFHSFRRSRTAHLRKNRVPWDLQKRLLGHANKDVTDRKAEQLKEDVEWRNGSYLGYRNGRNRSAESRLTD